MTRIQLLVIPVILVIIGTAIFLIRDASDSQVPDPGAPDSTTLSTDDGSPASSPHSKPATGYVDVKLKKKRFFEYLLPMIKVANKEIIEERNTLLRLQERHGLNSALSSDELLQLSLLGNKYKLALENSEHDIAAYLSELLARIDIIPASLILAQSANESAWGTSRFAREANNYFGMWCFTPGCGVTPARRTAGMTHEVAKFDSVEQGVSRYVLNLNTNSAYEVLRKIRAGLRQSNAEITGVDLAEGLERYSERGHAYVEEIQSMIRFNKLEEFNQKQSD